MKPLTDSMAICDIKIGPRYRKDLGDIAGLAESIRDVGLLHPVAVTPDGKLIIGARRLAAVKLNGETQIPVTVIDLEEIARGEWAENTHRKNFTWSEAVAIKRALEPAEREAAKERQRQGGRAGGQASGKLPQASKGKAGDKVAKAVGKKRRSLEKATAVVEAAEAEPKLYSDLAQRLDEEDARVDIIHRELKQRQARAEYESQIINGCTVDDLAALAAEGKRFAAIYSDPPWEFDVYSGKGKQRSADRYYDTMTLAEIKALPVAALAAEHSVLFLWGVWPELTGAKDVIESWGFEYKTAAFVWVKQVSDENQNLHWGMGHWTRANTEPCLLAVKGSPMRVSNDVHQVILAPVSEHSAKPEETRQRIERLIVGPYLELFARKPVKGWTTWGNQIPRNRMSEAAE